MLAVPLVTTACSPHHAAATSTGGIGSGAVSTSTGGSSTGGGSSSGFGQDLCARCAARGLLCNPWATGCLTVFGTATTTSGGSTGGSECPSIGVCPSICDCVTSVIRQPALEGSIADDGGLNLCQCEQGCPELIDGGTGSSNFAGCGGTVVDAGPGDGGPLWDVTCYYYTTCTGGRRPAGTVLRACSAPSEAGAYFAQLAQLEAVSIRAFRHLATELQHHRAPRALIRRARTAARDEVRHTRLTRILARRYRATPATVQSSPRHDRPLEHLASENAREGCVRETFGAAVAFWQAQYAADPAVREVTASLWRDEAQHAQLAWDLDRWLRPQLSLAARRRVSAVRAEEISTLARAPGASRSLAHAAGLPTTAEQARLIEQLRATVWSEA